MRSTYLLAAVFFPCVLVSAHPKAHDLEYAYGYNTSIAATDRGTLTINCKGAEDACNNLCYDMRCRNGPSSFMRKKEDSDILNRRESGCRADAGGGSSTPCKIQDLRKTFVWARNNKDYEPVECDEWPPASFEQKKFNNGRHPNSLRCMPSEENKEAGLQIMRFLESEGSYPGRTGKGKIEEGQKFSVTWNTKNADTSRTYYCDRKASDPNMCDNDGLEFHMTRKSQKSGTLNEAYNYDRDNHYALKSTNIKRCTIRLQRLAFPQNPTEVAIRLEDDDGNAIDTAMGHADKGHTFKLEGLQDIQSPSKVSFKDDAEDSVVSYDFGGLKWKSNDEVGGKKWCEMTDPTNPGDGVMTTCSFGCFIN